MYSHWNRITQDIFKYLRCWSLIGRKKSPALQNFCGYYVLPPVRTLHYNHSVQLESNLELGHTSQQHLRRRSQAELPLRPKQCGLFSHLVHCHMRCSLSHPCAHLTFLLTGLDDDTLNPSAPWLDFMQLQKANMDNSRKQLLLIWDALPATALTPVTYSLTLQTGKELGKSGNKNRFLNFGWQDWDLSSNCKYQNLRAGDQLWLLVHIHAFIKIPSCLGQVFPTERFVWMISTCSQTFPFVSVWDRTAKWWVFSGTCASIRSAVLRI